MSEEKRRRHYMAEEVKAAPHVRGLGVIALISITYFNVCGGPASVEIMSSMGPLLGFIGLIIMPIVWACPLALVTCELSTAFPDNGGYGLWVSEAYGEFWGFMESYWSWVSIVVDSALYPVLAYTIATKPFLPAGTELSWGYAYMVKLGLVILWTIPNLLGLQLVGNGLLVLGVFVLVPFILFSIYCLMYFDANNIWVIGPGTYVEGNPWLSLITNLFWNYSGFDCISTVAGEIHEPKKTLPRALLGSLVLVIFSYFFPLVFASAAAMPPAAQWSQQGDSWSVIAQNVGGLWLCTAIIVACFLGNMGLYIAKMFENSWQMQGMAAAGVIPSVFKQIHPRFRSPWNATILSFFIIAILVSFDFNFIVTIDTTFNCAAALLEMFAFFSLRMNRPNLKRPFKIPVHSRLGLCLFLTPPVIIGSFVLFNGFFQSLYTAAVNVAATLLGFALFFIMKKMGLVNYTYKTRKESVDSGSEESVDESIPLINSSSDEERKNTKVVRRASSFRQEYVRMNSKDLERADRPIGLTRLNSRELDKDNPSKGIGFARMNSRDLDSNSNSKSLSRMNSRELDKGGSDPNYIPSLEKIALPLPLPKVKEVTNELSYSPS